MAVRDETDVRVAVIGNVDSGKSTLVGVLTKGIMDDGRGSARMKVFNFSHEQSNGRTSSIGQEIMGFTGDEVIVPERANATKNQSW
jgi:GTPase